MRHAERSRLHAERSRLHYVSALGLALALGACANAGSAPELTTAVPPAAPESTAPATGALRPVSQTSTAAAAPAAQVGAVPSTAAYTMTEEEKNLSCRALTGRMQVRILQIRDWESQSKPSSIAQAMQKTVSALWPGDTGTSLSDERYVRDRAQLEAYNRELAAKKCKTFNLEEELGAHPIGHTPMPSR